jgi:choline dehydrogenase-like flavoprotein
MARFLARETGRPFFHYVITVRSEMLPSAGNRVFLTAERDRSGLFRPGVRCVLDARDLLNVEQTLRVLGGALMRQSKGRVRVNNDRIYKQVGGGGHTMGTTRMGASRATSVVDRDCRVHGYRNLFVAGSSVFPTGGYANPTLTIVALGLRLADRLVKTGGAS